MHSIIKNCGEDFIPIIGITDGDYENISSGAIGKKKGRKMNVKVISVKVILLYSFMIAAFLTPVIMINHASIASIVTVVILISGYISAEVYLWKQKMNEEEKEFMHLGVIGIPVSISCLILAITFLKYGYGEMANIPSILFLSIYCLSGILFTRLFLKRARASARKIKSALSAGIGQIAVAVLGLGAAKFLLRDISQSTAILLAIGIFYLLSITFLLVALNSFCKFLLKREERLRLNGNHENE